MRISDWSSDVCSSGLDEALARDQFGRPRLEGADAQLRPLQVDEDRRRTAGLFFQRAARGDRLRMAGVVAVARVDAKGVGAGTVQRRDHRGIRARWTKGRQDTHLAPAGGETLKDRTRVV